MFVMKRFSKTREGGWGGIKISSYGYSDQVVFSRETYTIELTLLLCYIAKI